MQGSMFPEMEYSRKKVLGNDAVAYADWPELIARMLTCFPGSRRKRGRRQRMAQSTASAQTPTCARAEAHQLRATTLTHSGTRTLRSSTSRQKSWPTRASALKRWCHIFASSPVAWPLASSASARQVCAGSGGTRVGARKRPARGKRLACGRRQPATPSLSLFYFLRVL